MDQVQWIARKALLPLFAALTSPLLQAAGLQGSLDLAPSELAATPLLPGTLPQSAASLTAANLALIAQVGDSLIATLVQDGYAQEALILQSGYGHEAAIEQHGIYNQGSIIQSGADNQARIEQFGAANSALIEQTGTGHRSRVTQHGQGLDLVVRQYR